MSKIDDGGPVFPTLARVGRVTQSEGGLSLRDYFAGQALTGSIWTYIRNRNSYGDRPSLSDCKEVGCIVEDAYAIADAMLAARKEGAE